MQQKLFLHVGQLYTCRKLGNKSLPDDVLIGGEDDDEEVVVAGVGGQGVVIVAGQSGHLL